MNSNQFIGIGLRHQHYDEIINNNYQVGWLEVHSENFFMDGGPSINFLKKVRKKYPLSIHGIGLSLGSAETPNIKHLTQLKNLINDIDPFLVSEHLSWNSLNNTFFPDLFPIPYNQESLEIFSKNVEIAQNFIKKEILIENPSSYIEFKSSTIEEPLFLQKLVQKTGCKILLDVNNVFVSSFNNKWNPLSYLEEIPKHCVKEIHLAGHSDQTLQNGEQIKIDTHDNFVCDDVFELYKQAIKKFGIIHSLLEWDNKIPPINTLIDEAQKVKKYWLTYHYEE